MANLLNNYNPQYWANQALMLLTTRKGYASRIFRGYEEERSTFGRGDVINFRKPMQFTAKDIYSSGLVTGDAEELDTPKSSLTLDKHQATFFKVTDKDLTFAGDRIVTDHIAPAVDALAQKMDMDIATEMAAKVPHVYDASGLASGNCAAKLAELRKVMVENLVPRDGKPLTYVSSPSTMAVLLSDPAFTQYQGADGTGVAAQVSGLLGRKFGFDWFETTNTVSHVGPSAAVDAAGALVGATPSSQLSISVDGMGSTEVYGAGKIISIAGDKYVLAADATMSGGAGTLVLKTGTRKAYANDAAVLILADADGSFEQDIVFHPNAAALVVAPLPMHSSSLGANVYTATDPATGLSVRARMNYDNLSGEVNVIFDVLYGIAMIDEQLAVRVKL